MADEDEIRRAQDAFASATRSVHEALPGKPGFGNEAKYGEAYQRLVRLGVKPQLRLKYRRG